MKTLQTKQVQLLCHWMQRLSLFWLVAGPLLALTIWAFLPWIPDNLRNEFLHQTPTGPITWLVRSLGMLASIPGIVVHILLFWQLFRLFGLWEKGILLENANIDCFGQLGKLYLLSALVGVVQRSFYSIALSISNPPGQRTLSLGLSSDDISSVAMGLFLWLIAYTLEQAHRIKQEADLTV